jgi:hypothetical protein
LNIYLHKGAERSKAVAVVFPALRSPSDIARLLAALISDSRWKLEERQWRDDARPEDLLLWLRWRTATGALTSVMGLAPLGSMPAHRRAPFVSLVIWPGARENPAHIPKGSTLGFLDIKLPAKLAEPETYNSTYERTKSDVAELKRLPAEGSARADVTFCLPGDTRHLLNSCLRPNE